jgi:hypothetical protein
VVAPERAWEFESPLPHLKKDEAYVLHLFIYIITPAAKEKAF